MKTKLQFLNLLVVVSMVLMAISPAVASAAPAASVPQPSAAANSGPVVSQPVSPAKTDGLPPAPTVKAVPESEGFNPDRPYNRPLAKTSVPANPSGDAALQTQPGVVNMPAPLVNFEGVNNISGYYPPDTDGEVGPNHYVQMVNVSMAIYDKSGTLLYGPFFPHSLWPSGDICNGPDDGDPVVIYDQLSDRWLVTQFALPNYPNGPFYECIAVSKTGVPTNVPSDWYPYTFLVSNTKMDDYPKISVWPDAYYMTDNQFTAGAGDWAGVGVFAFDRAKMLTGQPATFQYFDLAITNPDLWGGMLPADLDGSNPPPAGSPAYFFEVDDNVASPALGTDAARIWKFHVDWTTPANSTFGVAGQQPNAVLPVASFDYLPCSLSGARGCIPQQSSTQKLDAIGDRLMFRATYRNFGDHESVMLNHTVLADGTDRAGIRWYEIRDPGATPSIYQQGTYAPADGQYRWMGSLAQDHVGNVALGYSVSSSTLDPSIRYAGRLATDPSGTLPQAEASIIAGSGAQTGSGARWGDYSAMSVDPVDDCTFWYTTEYIQTTGAVSWQTRIASFKFPNCALGPQGTLAGVITNTATSAPIVGAAIQATASVTQSGATSSAAGGAYSMLLLTGDYTVTASAFGFLPTTVSGVSINENGTTTLDLGLDPAPSYVISGTVRDATAGWPLYAKIDINGYPGGPIWTDPATGFYSVTLPAGVTYLFNVSAYSAGYIPSSVSVGPLNANGTVNIGLTADAATCVAPGYSSSVSGYYENFDSATPPALPAGWAKVVVTTTSTVADWATNVGTRYPSGQSAHSAPNLVYFNSFSSGSSGAARLYRTSDIDLGTVPTTTLSFWMYHDTGYTSSADRVQVQISTDSGTTWQDVGAPVARYNGSTGWAQHTVSLVAYEKEVIRLGFLGISEYGNDVHVDDVLIGETPCLPEVGGLVVGDVKDINTAAALSGAAVSSPAGSTTTNGSGFYTLFSPAGSTPITASLANYKTEVATVTVPLSGTVRQDFLLGAGKLDAAPAAINVSLALGVSTTIPMTLTNSGNLAASFELIELDKGGVPYGPFDKPGYVVKPFRQDGWKNAKGLGIPNPPAYEPYAAGDVIQSWTPTGVTGPWGLAYDGNNDSVWVSSPSAAWSGTNQIFEFTPAGTATGRSYSYSWNPPNGPADAAYNWNTGMLWVMNINTGVANCIYEIDPASGPTGNKICPTGATGFATSQRGLAYDPSTDTYFAGGWNDEMVYQFKSDGTLLNSKNVGLAVAGLAYNPTTQHLFVVDSATATQFYVLDAANNYAALGSFSVTGFSTFGGTGLEIDCDGNLWAVDNAASKVYQITSGETASFCGSDVTWLSTSPVTGAVASAASQPVTVTVDSTTVEPGVYNAQIKIDHDTPYDVPNIPVTMTVTVPPTWGKLTGNVATLGYCDASPAALNNVTVTIQSALNTWNVVTDSNGDYRQWIDVSNNPLTVTVAPAGYAFGQATGVTLIAQGSATQDFTLRWLKPCVSVSPQAYTVNLNLGQSTSRNLRLNNNGGATAVYSLTEQHVSAPALPVYQPATNGSVPASIDGKGFSVSAQTSTGTVNQAPILLAPTAISLTHSLSQQIMAANSVSCSASGIHDDNHYLRVFDLPTFGISGALNVTAVQVGIETATAGTGSTQPVQVKLYTLTGAFTFANLTQIGSADVQVSNQTQTILNVPILASVPAGSKLVVDFFTPSGAASGHSLFVGSNTLGQTAPTYIAATACGISEPTDVSTIGFPGMMLVMNVIASGSAGSVDVPWLTEIPVSGTIASDTFLYTTIGFDANTVAVPGTYKANVIVNSNDPVNAARAANMTLNVTAPASWGVLTGTVNSLGYCDVNSAPLAGAKVVLQSANGLTRTITTDANGGYKLWLNSATNPYTLTVTAAQHLGSTPIGGLTVSQLGAISAAPAVNLRSAQPCVDYIPDSLSVTVPWKGSASQTLTLTNSGAASSLFTITEQTGGFNPMLPEAAPPILIVSAGAANTTRAYTTALTSLGYGYVITTSAVFATIPTTTLVTKYQAVFYSGYPSPFSTQMTKTVDYLNAGGRFFISENDLGYYYNSYTTTVNLYRDYLEATYIADAGSKGVITGTDIMAGIVTSIAADPYPDSFSINGPDGVGLFYTPTLSTIWAGERIARLGYKAIYLAWDYENAGGSTVGDPVETTIMQNVVNWLGLTSADFIPWLTETPTQGSLPASGQQSVALNFDANVPEVTQPGTYYGTLAVKTQDLMNPTYYVPVTMTVQPLAAQAKLNGMISGLGYCDANPAPLNGASLLVQGTGGYNVALTTNAAGYYQQWIDAAMAPLTLTVSAANHVDVVVTGVSLTGAQTTTQNINLRWFKPCVGFTPNAGLSANVAWGMSTTLPLTLSNAGAASTPFTLTKVVGGFISARPEGNVPLATFTEGFEDTTFPPTGWTRFEVDGSTTYQWVRSTTSPHTGTGVAYHSYGSTSPAEDGMLMTPDLELGAASQLAFWERTTFPTDYEAGGHSVWVCTASCNTPPANYIQLSETGALTDTNWRQQAISLSGYANQIVRLAFRYKGTFADGWYLDDVSVTDAAVVDPVPWVMAVPVTGIVAADTGTQTVLATFDASVSAIKQPGLYYATFNFATSDPVKPSLNVPISMTVTPPATWGKLTGVINGLAACDVNPAPLANADVLVQGATMSWTLKTNASGVYQIWADVAQNSLSVTASKSGFVSQSVAGISLTGTQTTTQDLNLRAILPCASSAPSNLSTTLLPNRQQTQTLTISNTGAAALTWNIQESASSVLESAPDLSVALDARTAPVHTGRNTPRYVPSPDAVVLSEGFESGVVPPAGWTKVANNAAYSWKAAMTSPHSGSYNADVEYDPALVAQNEWLLSPEVTLSAGTLSFWSFGSPYWCRDTYDNCDVDVWLVVGTVGGGDDVYVGSADTAWPAGTPYIWAQSVFTLTSLLPSGAVRIGFNYVGVDGAQAALDDIVLDGSTGATCENNSLPWVSTAPISGTTAPDSYSNIDVVFDSTGLGSGVHTGNLCVNTNDATHSKVLVPVSLTVPTPTLTLHTVGNGTIVADPAGNYDYGNVITLTATPDSGWHFTAWSGDLTGSVNPITFTLNGDTVVTATFAINTYTITPAAGANGSITPNTPQTVNYGASQTFAIAANTGYHISDVGVDGASIGVTSLYTFTNVTANHTITATFAPNAVNLTVNVVGNGSVAKDPDQAYHYGDVVTLTANADTNWAFAGWSGDLGGAVNPSAITLMGDKVVTATFASTCVPVSGVDFTYLPTAPKVNKIVTFDGTATGTTPITYTWDFGDASAVGSGTPITHLFPITLTTHSYTVTMTAANACSTVPVLKSLTVQPQTIFLPIVKK